MFITCPETVQLRFLLPSHSIFVRSILFIILTPEATCLIAYSLEIYQQKVLCKLFAKSAQLEVCEIVKILLF
jgi:hypothetical protein